MRDHADLFRLRLHHFDGCDQARLLREAADGDGTARRFAGTGFLEYFAREVVPHIEEEERDLLPLLLASHAEVARIVRDHEHLRALARRLRDAPGDEAPPPDLLREIADLLDEHIALEERSIYPEAAERLIERGQSHAFGDARPG